MIIGKSHLLNRVNPVRAGITDRPEEYPWSSYPFYIGRKKKPEWLAVDFILSYFGKRASTAQKRYQEFVEGRIGQQYESPLKSTVASTILGGVDFVGKIREKYLKGKKVDRNVGLKRTDPKALHRRNR
jgi:hypothetical protein